MKIQSQFTINKLYVIITNIIDSRSITLCKPELQHITSLQKVIGINYKDSENNK